MKEMEAKEIALEKKREEEMYMQEVEDIWSDSEFCKNVHKINYTNPDRLFFMNMT